MGGATPAGSQGAFLEETWARGPDLGLWWLGLQDSICPSAEKPGVSMLQDRPGEVR